MRRTTWKQIGVGAMAALLAVGCATGRPQRRPDGTGSTVQGSTTGTVDACSLALGNAPHAGTTGGGGGTTGAGGTTGTTGAALKGGTGTHDNTAAGGTTGTVSGAPLGSTDGVTEPTANGIMVGNVAIVALPDYDYLPTTNPPGVTGTPPGAPSTLGTPATPGNPAAPGTPGTAGTPGVPGTAGGGGGGTAGTTGYTGTTVPPGNMGVADGGLPGTGDRFGTAGRTGTPGPRGTAAGGGTAAGSAATGNINQTGGSTALDRIRTACVGLSEIRVVTESADKARLAEIAMAMRRGTPVTAYMADITRLASRASLAGGGVGTGAGGGGGGAVTPQSHGPGPAQETPGTQGNPAAP